MARFMEFSVTADEPVSINIDKIAYVRKAGDGTIIYFAAGKSDGLCSVRVEGSYRQTMDRIHAMRD